MLIDLHNHTAISSSCSVLLAEELIENARQHGLDALCVTEHFSIEGAQVAQAVGRQLGFPVFRGIEARSQWGDMLVYGYYRDIPEGIALTTLCAQVRAVGGVVFIAHPYRPIYSTLYTELQQLGMNLDTVWQDLDELHQVDGIEVINGSHHNEAYDAQAYDLAHRLQVPGIGGSDAHSIPAIGTAATYFDQPITSDAELVAALKSGSYRPVRLRQAQKRRT